MMAALIKRFVNYGSHQSEAEISLKANSACIASQSHHGFINGIYQNCEVKNNFTPM